jgi:hypothetical protein
MPDSMSGIFFYKNVTNYVRLRKILCTQYQLKTQTMETSTAISNANPRYRQIAFIIGAILSVAFWVVLFIIL